MMQGIYIGDRIDLQGETALLIDSDDPAYYLAQFDNIDKFGQHKSSLAIGWHKFPKVYFEVINENK